MENYEDKMRKLKEQYKILINAEECIKINIKELTDKKTIKMTQLADNICRNDQIENIDRKITTLLKRREEKKKNIEKVQAELDELQKNTEQVIHKTKERVY